jgi:threonine 3-dehydrogenase
MRIVVTGGSGFVGAHLTRALVARGDEVTILDVVPASPLLDDVPDIARRRCDVSSWTELSHELKAAAPEVVFHTAGILSASAEERPHAAYEANSTGTWNVLQAASLLDIPRVVFTSTMATYGPGIPAVADQTTQQRPTTMYGVTKVFGELLGEYFGLHLGLDFRAVRLPALMGAGRGAGGASAYGSLIVSEAMRTGAYAVPVAPDTIMALAYIKDVVAGMLALSGAPLGDLHHRTYGLDGFAPTAGALADAVRRVLPEAAIDFDEDEQLSAIVDTWPERLDGSAAAADWGWSPRFDLDAAVADFVAELRAQPTWA